MKLTFTTSWDDGSVQDLRVAELLRKHAMRGTFYIPQEFSSSGGKYASYDRRLSDEEIRQLGGEQEIGSHALTHQALTELAPDAARREIAQSKQWLDTLVGKETAMFCYPLGRFDDTLKKEVRDAGYRGARTTQKLSFEMPHDPYARGVSLLINPYPLRRTDAEHIYWRRALDPLRAWGLSYLSYPQLWHFSWQSMARALFKYAYRKGNYFHLYGHSWELEQYGMWGELGSFLDFVKEHQDIEYRTNGEI